MRVLILGGTGGVGRHLVSQARERGHHVAAIVRPDAAFDGPCLRGDPLDPTLLRTAMTGVDAVVSSLGLRRRHVWNPYSAILGRPDLNSASAGAIVAAMRDTGVTRVVAVSAAGVGDSAPRMNAFMRMLVATSSIGVAYRDMALMEQIFAESGLDWCCPRPVTLTEGPHTGRIREVDRFGATMSISRADVAHGCLDRAEGASGPRLPQLASA
jgi:uncharacterized protein YbjT (DUF2867 family)